MSELNIERARFNMIEQQVRPWDVLDPRVLEVLAEVPREEFVPAAHRALAFSDLSIPLGHGQYMMPPRLEGRLLQALDLRPSDRVLEVGTGSGYLTACLARLAGSVLSVDIHADFVETARRKLAGHGIQNAELRVQDAAAGWNEEDAFDAIAVTGSLPRLHRGFHTSLKSGGRLFVMVGQPPLMEALLINRASLQEWTQESLFEASLPPLIHAEGPSKFVF